MDFAPIIVILLRLIVPVSILRYPLAGIIASFVFDASDFGLVTMLCGKSLGGGIISYHVMDKLLDIYYLSFAFFVALKWEVPLVRTTIISLFSIRFIGTLLFVFTGFHPFLFFFPNIFELFFIYCLLAPKLFPRFYPDTISKLLIVLLILSIPKLILEYFQHYKQIIGWSWIKDTFNWIKTTFIKT